MKIELSCGVVVSTVDPISENMVQLKSDGGEDGLIVAYTEDKNGGYMTPHRGIVQVIRIENLLPLANFLTILHSKMSD